MRPACERPIPAWGGVEGHGCITQSLEGDLHPRGGRTVDIIFVRLLFVILVAATCFVIQPFGRPANIDAGIGALIGALIVVFEWKLRTVSLKRLIGAAIGSILGICGAYLF